MAFMRLIALCSILSFTATSLLSEDKNEPKIELVEITLAKLMKVI